jgi:DUF4097 and DUF4098 domain-containing protein YvlB
VYTFETSHRPTLVVRTGAGTVTVTATATDRTTVELTPLNAVAKDAIDQAVVEEQDGTVVVDLPRHRVGLFRQGPVFDVAVTCPNGTVLQVKAESSDVRATGTFAEALVTTGSGDIDVETVTGAAKLKSGSGAVVAGQVGDALLVTTGSGNVSVHQSGQSTKLTAGSGDISIGELAGQVVTKSGSGDVEVGRLDGALMTKSGSGSLTVRRAASGSVKASGASGSISIGVEEGTAAWLDVSTVSGRVRQELGEADAPRDDQQRVEITAHTVSGDLRVHRS